MSVSVSVGQRTERLRRIRDMHLLGANFLWILMDAGVGRRLRVRSVLSRSLQQSGCPRPIVNPGGRRVIWGYFGLALGLTLPTLKMLLDDCFGLAPARGVFVQELLAAGKTQAYCKHAKLLGIGRKLRDRGVRNTPQNRFDTPKETVRGA